MDAERRRNPRERITVTVRYAGTSPRSDYTDNVSRTGMFILTTRSRAIGTRFRCLISFPRLLPPITVVAVVRWMRTDPSEERGLGIEFEAVEPEARAQLDLFLDWVRAVPID